VQVFHVADEAFYNALSRHTPVDIEGCARQLVDRYDIQNRSILSLGGGAAAEEYYLTRFGNNRLTVIDIDEHGAIRPILETLPAGPLNYIIGDAQQVDAPEFDLLFISGFTPDELRRSDVHRQRDTDDYQLMIERHGGWEWPPWRDPFHPIVHQYLERLPAGGLFIAQSYCGGLDAIGNRFYLPACERQLLSLGLELLEVWRFTETVGVMLYVAQKHGGQRPRMQAPLTRFHGRAEKVESIERIFPNGPAVGRAPLMRKLHRILRG
jgi:hypothetical protein